MKIETILTPAELPALAQRDLRATACVVFDVLRATTAFLNLTPSTKLLREINQA